MWPYENAREVYVAGDVVGSWSKRVKLQRCSKRMGCGEGVLANQLFIELDGLPPGRYAYKFIVDGCWMTDRAMPLTWDEGNNANNVHVVETWPTPLTARGRLQMARLEAAR